MADPKNYQTIEIPYNNLLERETSNPADTSAKSTVSENTNTQNSASAITPGGTSTSGASSSNGSVESMPVKSDGAMGDLWIKNFIKSQNWKPKTVGFYIDGQTGYAEFSNVFVSGNIQALTGLIGGFTIGATDLSATDGVNTTKISSGSTAFSAGPTNAPTITITKDGSINASSGTIAGWDIQSNLLRSVASSNSRRIELNKEKNRISIFDAVNEKVAMGYLDGLPKHDGTGNWGVGDYGFWALAGDKLSIDGDGEYVNGDWIIQHDAAYLINDALNRTIVRLGTDSGEKGLFIYNTSGTKLAKYTSDQIFIGEATKYLRYTVLGGLEIAGSITATTGSIGGFIIGATTITSTGLTLSSGTSASLAFGVTPPTSPILGTGIFMDKTGLFGLNANTQKFKIDATNGSLTATSADISGAIKTGAGSIINGSYVDSLSVGKLTTGTFTSNTMTLGSAATDGYIRSYGWNGSVNGFQIKGGATPSITVIGGTITGGTIQTSAATNVDRIIMSGANNDIEFWSLDNTKTGELSTWYDAGFGTGGMELTAGGLSFNVSGKSTQGIINMSLPDSIFFGLDWYGNNVSTERIVTNGRIDADWMPYANNNKDLGSTTYKWKDGFFAGSITVGGTVDGVDIAGHTHTGGAGGTVAHSSLSGIGANDHHSSTSNGLSITPSDITTGNILPNSDGDHNLGSSSYGWNDIYCDSLYKGNDAYIDFGASYIDIFKHLYPAKDNTYTCGGTSYRWSDLRSVLINGSSFLSEKNVIKYIDDYDFIGKMPRLIEFTWKKENDSNKGKIFWGFAADDMPSQIANEEDKSVNVLGSVAYSLGAVKQLSKLVKELEDRIKILENKKVE